MGAPLARPLQLLVHGKRVGERQQRGVQLSQALEWNGGLRLGCRARRRRIGLWLDEILLGHALPWFVSAERYHEAAKAVFAKHGAQNVRYVETSFHLPVTGFIGVPGREIIAAIRAAVPAGLEVRIFAGMLRTDYVGPMRRTRSATSSSRARSSQTSAAVVIPRPASIT